MIDDPIVEEIRAIRQSIAERFNYDLDAIVADLREKEKRHPERFESSKAQEKQAQERPGTGV